MRSILRLLLLVPLVALALPILAVAGAAAGGAFALFLAWGVSGRMAAPSVRFDPDTLLAEMRMLAQRADGLGGEDRDRLAHLAAGVVLGITDADTRNRAYADALTRRTAHRAEDGHANDLAAIRRVLDDDTGGTLH